MSTTIANLAEALEITGAPEGDYETETRGVIAEYVNGRDGDVLVAWVSDGGCRECRMEGTIEWPGLPQLVWFDGGWESTDQCGTCGSRWGAHADYATGDDSLDDLIESIKAVLPKRYRNT